MLQMHGPLLEDL